MQTKLKLRVEPKQPVQVNKPVVLAVASVVVFVMLLAIINAFNATKSVKEGSATLSKMSTDKPIEVNAGFNDLPNSYSDVNGIKKYSSGGQNEEMAKLQRQVDELKNSYGLLENQLRLASQLRERTPELARVDPQTQQAKTSSLVFSGLGSVIDNPASSDSRSNLGKLSGKQTGDSDLVVTPEQEKFFKDKAENEQKLAVMKGTDKPEEVLGTHRQMSIISPYQIQRGTMIPATLISGINTIVPGAVIAQVRQNIYDTVTGKYLLIPRGSKLLGEYSTRGISYGQDRISVQFTSLVRPDGSSIVLDSPIAYDLQGRAGVVSKVDNHWGQVLGSAVISTALSVGAAAAGGSTNDQHLTTWNRGFSGAAGGMSRAGQALTDRAMTIPPTITVDAGYQFNIFLKKDIVLTPYRFMR